MIFINVIVLIWIFALPKLTLLFLVCSSADAYASRLHYEAEAQHKLGTREGTAKYEKLSKQSDGMLKASKLNRWVVVLLEDVPQLTVEIGLWTSGSLDRQIVLFMLCVGFTVLNLIKNSVYLAGCAHHFSLLSEMAGSSPYLQA